MIDILLTYICSFEYFNDLDTKSDFEKKIVTKKLVK